ncbi:Putative RxLR effector [Phytophthora palmivora]|uniref:RxLR effector n=1 Tax=Phytophthora palmivora TaxID=4796 RepID=A0A2P4X0I6_9STRA|nr:Putative RxLR effector [Phytophthora palmivora]
MRLVLLIPIILGCMYNALLVYAKEIDFESPSITKTIHGESNYRRLQKNKTAAYTTDTTDGPQEERSWTLFQRLKKLKISLKRNPKSAAVLQHDPSVIKMAEKLKSNPVIVNELKGNPKITQRLNSLAENPAAIESLQKAPVDKSVKALQGYLFKSQSRWPEGDKKMFVLGIFLLIMMGTLLIVLGTTSF